MTTPTTVQVRLQIRADTAANWTSVNPILLANELGLESDSKKFKVGNGSSAWNDLAYFPSIVSGGTVLGNLEIGTTGTLTFEGSTADGFETTLGVVDPTADRTILLPNQSGTVVVGGNASITNADIAANAEIAVSKLANGTANQVLVTDGTDVSWSDNLTLAGDLTVNGTTTTINTETLTVKDKNIELAVVDTPTDVTADGGGITLKGTTDKTINWVDATDAWTSSERFSVPLGTAAAPSLTFTGDENTGIYSPGADQLALSTNGTGRLFVDASGNVGVGAAPAVTLDVTGQIRSYSTGANPYVSANNGTINNYLSTTSTYGSVGTSSNHPLALLTNDTERLRITSAGLVGVGTSSPDSILDVRSSTAAGRTNISFLNPASPNTANRIRIRLAPSSGFVGIDSHPYIESYCEDAVNQFAGLAFGTYGSGGVLSERLRIDSSGRVGIGSSVPQAELNVAKTGGAATVYIESDAGNNATTSILRFGGASGRSASIQGFRGASSNIHSLNFYTYNSGDSFGMSLTPTGLGIGVTSASEALHVVSATDNQGAIIENSTSRASLTIKSAATTSSSYVNFGNPNGSSRAFLDYRESLNRLLISTSTASGELVFATGSQSERFRCDSSGRLLVGTSSSLDLGSRLQVVNESGVPLALFTGRNDLYGPDLILAKARGSTASPTVVSSGDQVGEIVFKGYSGAAGAYVEAARIEGYVDGTPDSGGDTTDMPGRLVFSTTADGASSPTERCRITSEGKLLIGKTDSSNTTVGVNLSGTGGENYFVYGVTGGLGQTMALNRTASDGSQIVFQRAGTTVGGISVNSSSTTYATSSDYRLKENVTPVTNGITRLQQLKPSRFNFIANPAQTVDGFIAHEVQAVVPEAITGTKDEVDADGNPKYQGIDQSKLVPLLTAALQEAIGEIESLKARVAALESA